MKGASKTSLLHISFHIDHMTFRYQFKCLAFVSTAKTFIKKHRLQGKSNMSLCAFRPLTSLECPFLNRIQRTIPHFPHISFLTSLHFCAVTPFHLPSQPKIKAAFRSTIQQHRNAATNFFRKHPKYLFCTLFISHESMRIYI